MLYLCFTEINYRFSLQFNDRLYNFTVEYFYFLKRKIMKKILFAVLILFGSVNAFAAEVSIFAGPYVGLDVGYSKGDSRGYESLNSSPDGIFDKGSLSKFLFGGLAGYNLAFNHNYLIGLEADFETRNSKNLAQLTDSGSGPLSDNVETKIKNSYSTRLRLGKILNNDQTMVYIAFGYAGADVVKNYNVGSGSLSKSKLQNGYTAGLGVEHFINDTISIKTEYRYSDYGKGTNLDVSSLLAAGYSESSKYENEHSVRFGLMYHF